MGRYAMMLNVVVDPLANGDIPDFEYAHSVKVAGVKASAYLARAAAAEEVDDVEVFEMETTRNEDPHPEPEKEKAMRRRYVEKAIGMLQEDGKEEMCETID